MSKTMDKAAASRIQSSTAIKNGGIVPKDSFAARAQSASSKQKPDNGSSKTCNLSNKK